MGKNDKRISIFSDLEQFAFYGFPDFDNEQRKTHFTFEEQEWKVIAKCRSLPARVHCALQMGYFKAKKLFFQFSINRVPKADVNFLVSTYFNNQILTKFSITKHENYIQRQAICHLFEYQLWSKTFSSQLEKRAQQIAKRDVAPNFIAHELVTFLQNEKTVRPGHTTLQDVVTSALVKERDRLYACLKTRLKPLHRKKLNQLLKTENTLSDLAALKQDAKDFNSDVMRNERRKHNILKPLYSIAKKVLPHLKISKQNIDYYASLTNYYTVSDLERFNAEQRYLYLLCYAFKRYQQITDTLVDAFDCHTKKFENSINKKAKERLVADHLKERKEIGKLLTLYSHDEKLSEDLTAKELCQMGFKILPKEVMQSIGEEWSNKPKRKQELKWKERDKASARYRHHLRPILETVQFDSSIPNNHLLTAIKWMKGIFAKGKSLSEQLFDDFPQAIISKRLRPFLIATDQEGKPEMNTNRFEILVYTQLVRQLETGALYVENSTRHKTFDHELNAFEKDEETLKALNIPWFQKPCEEHVSALLERLDTLWAEFNDRLTKDDLKHIKYDKIKKTILWVKPKIIKEDDLENDETLYGKIPVCDIADVLRFVNEKTGFLSALTPLQPRYNKQKTEEDQIIAVMISQATNVGNHKMAATSDIPYHKLESTYDQYMRLATLRKAHDIIANAISQLPIFPHYTFDLNDLLYGAVDGQQFEMTTPTSKARHSRKQFGKGRGVSAYTLLCNHVPLQCELNGPHDHESYFLFDVWYNNKTLIRPTIVTSDMHGINKANFCALYWFGAELRPRFTNLKTELKNVFCGKNLAVYENFLVQPAGQINPQFINREQENIGKIVTSLALKENSQSNLIKKLCHLPSTNKTKQAVYEFDKLVRSIYTLNCILHPEILDNAHRSQNRVESYHNLRASIVRAGGEKALLGRTDLEVEINNQINRLLGTAVIYYNSAILSELLEKLEKTVPDKNKKKLLKKVKKSSPVAWRNVHFTGHFVFYGNKKIISIEDMLDLFDFY